MENHKLMHNLWIEGERDGRWGERGQKGGQGRCEKMFGSWMRDGVVDNEEEVLSVQSGQLGGKCVNM